MVSLLFDIGLIIIVATIFAYVARLLRQPLLIAYVLAGVLIGPAGLKLITNFEEINVLAELGIAFLLFTVGLEIDFKKLRHVGTALILGGIAQILITFGVGFFLAYLLGFSTLLGIYIGLLIAFSSTMIVTRLLVDKDEIRTLHGRIMIGILILQDIVVVLAIPLLSNITTILTPEIFGDILIKGLGLFSIAIVLNRFIFPKILDYAAEMQEILFLTAISVCFLFIGFASALGFSIVIGAFIAGIALGNFPYNLEIVGETHALMDFFSIIFFTTLGMQLSMSIIHGMFTEFVVILLAVLILKPLILNFIYLILGYGGRISSMIGIGLGQASEFSFILAAQGFLLGHLSLDHYSLIISVVVVSMVVTPYYLGARKKLSKISSRLLRKSILEKISTPRSVHELGKRPEQRLNNHIIIIGADVMGRKIIDYLKRKRKVFVVVEHDPEKVKMLSKEGMYSIYGDADNEECLKRVGIYNADIVIITIPYADIASFVIKKTKRSNPDAKIFARAYSKNEADELYKAGADYVVVPEIISGQKIISKIGGIM